MKEISFSTTITTLLLFVLMVCAACIGFAQGPAFVGTNINVATGIGSPFFGDPYFQKDTEGCAMVSPRDPQTRAIANIDFAAVTTAGDTGDPVFFEAWPVLNVTHDGLHFYKVNFPGRPGTNSPADLSSPAFGMQFGSDPSCAVTPGGKLHVIWLAGVRNGPSRMIVSTFEHRNNLEGAVNVVHLYSRELARGSSSPGLFVDKPDIQGDTSGRLVACWTRFEGLEGKNFRNSIYCSRSLNAGNTWSNPVKVSKNFTHNQGVVNLLNPVNGSFHVIWRQIEDPGSANGPNPGQRMLMVSTADFGTSWSDPVSITGEIPTFDLKAQTPSLDDGRLAFRGNAIPAGGFGGDGKLYVVWTQFVSGIPQIVLTTGTPLSATSYSWTTPAPVAPGNDLQVLPAVATGGGQISVAYISFPFPSGFPSTIAFPPAIPNNVLCSDNSICGLGRRQEARLVQAPISPPPAAGSNPSPFSAPVILTRHLRNTDGDEINKWGVENPGDDPNAPIWKGGFFSFIGDYFGLSTEQDFVQSGASFRWATEPTDYAARNVFAVVPSNRDVVAPPNPNVLPWDYAAATAGSCGINPLSRDANMYMMDVFNELRAYAHLTSRKLTDTELRRAFPFTVEYRTLNPAAPSPLFFRLTLIEGAGVNASFVEPPNADLNVLEIRLEKNTSFTWSVHANSPSPDGRFRMKVEQITGFSPVGQLPLPPPVPNGKTTEILFNEDPANPAANHSDSHSININTKETRNPVASSPVASSPVASSPVASSPVASSPVASSPVASSYTISSAAFDDPQINTLGSTSNITKTRDIVTTVENGGNAVSSYNAFVHIPELATLVALGYQFQVILERVYLTPHLTPGPGGTCVIDELKLDEVITNIPSPVASSPVASSPVASSPVASSPVASSPVASSPVASSPVASSPVASSGTFAVAPSSPVASSLTLEDGVKPVALADGPDRVLHNDGTTHAHLGLEANQVKIIARVFATTDQLQPYVTNSPCGGTGQPACTFAPGVSPIDFTVVAHRPNSGETTPASDSTLPLNIETTSLPNATLGATYNRQLQLSGGAGPFTWTLFSGTLPTGLTLSPIGVISGTALATGLFNFTVKVTDSTSAFDTQALSINVPLALTWVPTTSANCLSGSPQVVVAGTSNTITMGVVDFTDELLPGQPQCIHGASAMLPAFPAGITKYQVTYTHAWFTWDSYNTDIFDGHTGYWDSFSVSVSGGAPYASLTLTDPLTGAQSLAAGTSFSPGFVWGGNDFHDLLGSSTLECNPGSTPCLSVPPPATRTDTMTGSVSATNYLNVVLDTTTTPDANHRHPSWGDTAIQKIVLVP